MIKKRTECRTASWKPPIKSQNEFRDTKIEKGTSQFCQSAGRCGAMRHDVHAGMPLRCLLRHPWGKLPPFSKKPSFLGNHSKYVGKQSLRPRPPIWARCQGQACSQGQRSLYRHVAKAQVAPYGHATKARACCQGQGMQQRARHAALRA